jgi:hypothetical protein
VSNPNLLAYERRPAGRVLIDEEPDGSVTVRVFDDPGTPRGTLLFFGFAGLGGVLAAARSARAGSVGETLAFGIVGVIALLATAWVIFGGRPEPIAFRATRAGLEYCHAALGRAIIPRADIADVFALPEGGRGDTATLWLRAPDGSQDALGAGATEEVVAIAGAMRKGLGIAAE